MKKVIICFSILMIAKNIGTDKNLKTNKSLKTLTDIVSKKKRKQIKKPINTALPEKGNFANRAPASQNINTHNKSIEIYTGLKDLPGSINLLKSNDYNPLKDKKEGHQVNLPHISDPRFSISLKTKKTLLQGSNPSISIEVLFTFEGQRIYLPYKVSVKNYNKMNESILEKNGVKKSALSFKLNSKLEAGDYIIQVIAHSNKINSNDPLVASSSFNIAPRFTKFLNKSRDFLDEDGNLHYQSYYKIMTKGHYLFESVINAEDGSPIALIENIVKLEKGNVWIDLPIHGHLFHKLDLDGRFKITHQRVRKVKANLALFSNKVEKLEYETDSYSLREFNSSPYKNQLLLDKIKKLSSIN